MSVEVPAQVARLRFSQRRVDLRERVIPGVRHLYIRSAQRPTNCTALLKASDNDSSVAGASAAVRRDDHVTVDVHNCPSQEQLTHLLDAFKTIDLDFYALVMLTAATGLRQGELLALHWDVVDLDAKTLHVRHTVEAIGQGKTRLLRLKSPKAKGSIRTLDLPAVAVATLREHRAAQGQIADKVHALLPRDALVFPAKPWEPHSPQDPGLVSVRFRAAAKRHGFREHLHQLRHTHTSLLLRAGIPIPDVSARLGHSNPGVTMKTYAHAIPTEQGHTVAAIEKMLGG